MTTDYLGMKDWTQLGASENADGDLLVEAVPPAEPPPFCDACGKAPPEKGWYKHGTTKRTIHDAPTGGKRRALLLHHPRWKCRDCGHTQWQMLTEVNGKRNITTRALSYVTKWVWDRTFRDLAHEIGTDEELIRRVFLDLADQLAKVYKPTTPVLMGIDEVHLSKSARGVIVDHETRTLLDILPDCRKDTFARRFEQMPDRERVRVVTMDMTPYYRDLVWQWFPHAVVIADKWHVLAHADRAFGSAFSRFRETLPRGRKSALWHDRFTFQKRRSSLTPDELVLLNTWTANYPEPLGVSYALKEAFHDVYLAQDRETAESRYIAWKAIVPETGQHWFRDVAATVDGWLEEFLNYFEYGRHTNARVEALNGRIKEAQRGGRGYSFAVLRAKMLYRVAPQVRTKINTAPEASWNKIASITVSQQGPAPTVADISQWFKPDEYRGVDISTLEERLTAGSL